MPYHDARQLLDATAPAPGQPRQHSPAFVPFLRAAQNLPHNNIPFMRALVGPANWDAAVARTRAVLAAVGFNSGNTPWGAGGVAHDYVGELHQLRLLWLEGHLRLHWPSDPAFPAPVPGVVARTGGEAFMALIGERFGRAEHVVAQADAQANVEVGV